MSHAPDFEVVIIGAGFAGIGLAIKLEEEGRRSYLILEKEADVGGTWYVNTYPGCACDVPSNLYSYSFEPNPNWTRAFPPQKEIWQYLRHCADKHGVRPHIRCSTEVQGARLDESDGLWHVTTAGGDRITARYLVAAIGALSQPRYPQIDGLDRFAGNIFHSQQWDHGVSLDGKRVAVIGTGASAIQVVPEVAKIAASLAVFQRSPPWVIKKPDRPFTRLERWMFRRLPMSQKLNRLMLYGTHEARAPGFTRYQFLLGLYEKIALRHLRRQVSDADLVARLTPDYRMGCKRVLLSDDYYPALMRDNVTLVDQPVARLEEDAVVAADGSRHEADVVILCTGFNVTAPLPAGFLTGVGGRDIADDWSDGPEAYLGSLVAGFPNFLMLVGPNAGLGHNSMIYMIESQIAYVMSALAAVDQGLIERVDLRPEVQQRYNEDIQNRLHGAVWETGGCTSWYLNDKGKNVALWPGTTLKFRKLTRHIDPDDFQSVVGSG